MTVTGTVLSSKAIPMHLAQEHEQRWVCAWFCCLYGAQEGPGRKAAPDPWTPPQHEGQGHFLPEAGTVPSKLCFPGSVCGSADTRSPYLLLIFSGGQANLIQT